MLRVKADHCLHHLNTITHNFFNLVDNLIQFSRSLIYVEGSSRLTLNRVALPSGLRWCPIVRVW